MVSNIKKFIIIAGLNLLIISILLLILEIIYTNQIIDTYKTELTAYNSAVDLIVNYQKKTILFLGDSFTAGNDSYP